MSYPDLLKAAARRHTDARLAARRAEARRDDLIRRAHGQGRMSTREIAVLVGLSFQRVAAVIAGDRDRPMRPTLHGAMEQVLAEGGHEWMPARELARAIYERGLYQRKDAGVISPGQIRARASKYSELFEGTADGSNRVRLRPRAPTSDGRR